MLTRIICMYGATEKRWKRSSSSNLIIFFILVVTCGAFPKLLTDEYLDLLLDPNPVRDPD